MSAVSPKKDSNTANLHHRHSLQHKPNEIPLPSNFRQTQSHRYDSQGKRLAKKAIVLTPIHPTINESSETDTDENKSQKKSEKLDQLTLENEKGVSKTSKKSDKSIYAFHNAGYEGNLDKKSISSRAGSSRQPSLQSLEVMREQYCCCARRTRCEKKLLLTVTVLSIVILVLFIVIGIIAANRPIGEDFKNTFSNWTT